METSLKIKSYFRDYQSKNSKYKRDYALLECGLCKKDFRVLKTNIKNRKTDRCQKCSYVGKGNSCLTHGMTETRLYKIWTGIKTRCFNKNKHNYNDYGGRGIVMSDEWKNDFTNFYKWSMDNGYADNLSIDRIDNDGIYEPSNCRWATNETQASNKRLIQRNNTTGYRGVTKNKKNSSRWRARIEHNKKVINLGHYAMKEDAAKAYDEYVIDNNLNRPLNFEAEALTQIERSKRIQALKDLV